MTAPDSHPPKILMKHELAFCGKTHGSPSSNLVRCEDFDSLQTRQCEIIYLFPSPPWENPAGELMNLELTRDAAKDRVPEQVREEEEIRSMVIFTGGSLTETGGGSAAVSRFGFRTLSCEQGGITNNELKLLAIGLAISQFKSNRLRGDVSQQYNALALFRDSQIALKRTHDPMTPTAMQYLAKSMKKFLSQLGDTQVRMYWTPGHEGIELNEKADEKAKEAANNENQMQLTLISLSKLLQVAREVFHLRTANFDMGRKYLRRQPRRVADALASMEKGEAAIIFHLRSGHSPLNGYLRRFNHHPTGRCDHCKVPETVAHLVLHCSHFKHQRNRFRKAIKEEEVKVNSYSLPALLDTTKVYPLLASFVLETGRFKFLKKYTQQTNNDMCDTNARPGP